MSEQRPVGRRAYGRARPIQEPTPAAPGRQAADTAATSSSGPRLTPRGRMIQQEQPELAPGRGPPLVEEQVPSTVTPEPETEPEYTSEVKQKELKALEVRPGFGTAGRKISLITNHYPLSFKSETLSVYRYEVAITSGNLPLRRREINRLFWAIVDGQTAFFSNIYMIAFDGVHMLLSLRKLSLPNGGDSWSVDTEMILPHDGRRRVVTLTLRFLGPVDVNMNDVRTVSVTEPAYTLPVQVLDVILRQGRRCASASYSASEKWDMYGPTAYVVADPRETNRPDPVPLEAARAMWLGLFASAHIAQGYKALLNLDVAHGTFFASEMNLVDFLVEFLNSCRVAGLRGPYAKTQLSARTALTDLEVRLFAKEIKGLRIRIPHINQHHRVRGLPEFGTVTAADSTFQHGEYGLITVAEYFARRQRPLMYPKLPVVRIGRPKKEALIPIEYCWIEYPQRSTKKLSDRQLAEVIKAAAVPAPMRQRKITGLKYLANYQSDPWCQNFGIEISHDMMKVPGRVLQPPKVEFGRVATVTPNNGAWRLDRVSLYRTNGPIDSYCLIKVRGVSDEDVGRFINALLKEGTALDVRFGQWPKGQIYTAENMQAYEGIFANIVKEAKEKDWNLQLIFVVLAEKSGLVYSEVKRLADVQFGIMTQCILARNLKSAKSQVLQNLILKINAKMGGVNFRLASEKIVPEIINEQTTMFIGIDVSHPPPYAPNTPSVAAIVSSTDLQATRYSASVKIQRHKREHIVYLREEFKERLVAFLRNTKQKPSKLIVYRDGVSEGEFRSVIRTELNDIRQACQGLDPEYMPPITFIVTMKRHHTRFFCEDPQQAVGTSQNVPPGTVVDTDITSMQIFDFYMVSHMGIQGTSRPVRYSVMCDENKLGADKLQEITHALTHVYCRCARSVSLPTPVYYAHLVAARAKFHLANKVADFGSDTMSTGTSVQLSEDELTRLVTVGENLFDSMYFV